MTAIELLPVGVPGPHPFFSPPVELKKDMVGRVKQFIVTWLAGHTCFLSPPGFSAVIMTALTP